MEGFCLLSIQAQTSHSAVFFDVFSSSTQMSTCFYSNWNRFGIAVFECLSIGATIAITSQVPIQFAAVAPIISDGSLGPNPSIVVPEASNQILVTGGTQSDANLFHSFQDFNVQLEPQPTCITARWHHPARHPVWPLLLYRDRGERQLQLQPTP